MIEIGFKTPLKLFKDGSCFVVGRKGTGKDVLFGNVVARRKQDVVSNLVYSDKLVTHPFVVEDFLLPSTYHDFLHDDLKYYEFPYDPGTDIYISDGGCFFPNYECLKLNKEYPGFIPFIMLSRQLGPDVNVHVNTQSYTRIWDKLREQFHYYILTKKCRWFKNLCPALIGKIPVLRDLCCLTIVVYERAASLETEAIEFRIKPPRKRMIRGGAKDETASQVWESQKMQHETSYGKVEKITMIYFNRSRHDTHYYKEAFKNGKKDEKTL